MVEGAATPRRRKIDQAQVPGGTTRGAAMTVASRRRGGELQVLLIALVLLAVATDVDVRCITIANAQAPGLKPQPALQNFTTFHQFEADALNAVLKNWTNGALNQQLFSILKWTSDVHPCNTSGMPSNYTGYVSNGVYGIDPYEGAWRGVHCTPVLQQSNSTGNYYDVSVTGLWLFGSNMSCKTTGSYSWGTPQCGFEGIQGFLPIEIAQLTNVEYISIQHHPDLTGAVPLQIWFMPNLAALSLVNNSLQGFVPSSSMNLSSKLSTIDLSYNNFGGELPVRSDGIIFTPSLINLFLVDNNFNGTFTCASNFSPLLIDLSLNSFTNIKFSNYTGIEFVYPNLHIFNAYDNQLSGPFPEEFLLMPYLEHLNLSGNQFVGSFPVEAITNLTLLDVSRNKFSGPLDFTRIIPKYPLQEFHDPDQIVFVDQILNFSKNHFNGTFSSGKYLNPLELYLSDNHFNRINFDIYDRTVDLCMPRLQKLYMDNNNGNGVFPIEILKAPMLEVLYADQNQYNILQLPHVEFDDFSLSRFGIFLTNNKIGNIEFLSVRGSPFSTSNIEFSDFIFLAGNPYCQNINTPLLSSVCRMNHSVDRPPLNVAQVSSTKSKAIIATSMSTFGLILFIISIYVWRLMRRIQSLGVILREFDKREVKPNLYAYKDIKLATNNFDKINKLGEGGFGVVYKGTLSDGTLVAVKKLTMSSSQILSEFLNEVVVISGVIHRNLVKLKGCCLGDGDQRILVFEYVENKNLAEALSLSDDIVETAKPKHLDWTTRFNIIHGIARGLSYLHDELQSPIIHRDIKAANVLLDKDYNPKIADFGLAYLFPTLENNESHLTMVQVVGTRGYLAPEYALHGHMSTALDVYSFGVLVLEIVCGRKNIDLQKISEETILPNWAWKLFKEHNVVALIDKRMEHTSSDVEAITRIINVALACIQFKSALRPKMHEVVHMLLGNMPINTFQKDHGDVALSFNIGYDATSTSEDNDISVGKFNSCSKLYEVEVSGRSC